MTKHHPNCGRYSPEKDAAEIINDLLTGIVAWATGEDGVHPDCWEAFFAAAVSVGRFDIVKKDNKSLKRGRHKRPRRQLFKKHTLKEGFAMPQIKKAEHQLIGFAVASRGWSILSLAESLGLSKLEWLKLRDSVDLKLFDKELLNEKFGV